MPPVPRKPPAAAPSQDPLRFKVAPHIVQDLGLNLYNSLPRVLVEFVANAYDADSPDAFIMMNTEAIHKARNIVRAQWKLEVETKGVEAAGDLDTRELPPNLQIVVLDRGHGMSRQDLQEKFLVAGRRRREEEPERKGRTDKGRLLMGRKGLGKFAGFGVAHAVTVITRKEGEQHATKMTLNYDDLIKKARTDEIVIPDETLPDGGGIKEKGTRIILSRLVYGPMKSRLETVAHAIADHFSDIDPDDFKIMVNNAPIEPEPRNLVYAWPKPELPVTDLVTHELEEEDRPKVTFKYRIRFTGSKKHLNARDRGVRIYSHKRLAAAPDLLDVKTGIHGFRNTEYLDGVVYADFIDDQSTEYIATDRQTLRWESPLLEPLRAFLSEEMTRACNEYQKVKDKQAEESAPVHSFTKELIEKAVLAKHRQKMAFQFAGKLASVCQGGIDGDEY